MDYYDEDPRPRFQFQASSIPIPQQSASIDRKHAAFCIGIGTLIFSYGCLLPGIWQILLAWIGLSLAIGPLAPISLTGGDIRVGCGEILEEPQIETPKLEPERKNYRGKAKRSENSNPEIPISNIPRSDEIPEENKNGEADARVSVVSRVSDDEEWTAEDVELLKKQLSKNPPGKPGRYDAIAEAFRGARSVDSIVKKAKSLGERKPGDDDSYAKFLAKRKISDKIEMNLAEGADLADEEEDRGKKLGWSSAEDIALLNALKTFPKDTNMRWEKVAAAVPGKSKTQCMKRFSELKLNFRNSKASDT